MIECPELPAIPGGWTLRDFTLAGCTLHVTLPAAPDAFLDDPEVLAANRRDDYMPYWSYLWPTSLETAVAVLKHDWADETEALEIGAGIALTGLAALSRGLRVAFSDYDRKALSLTMHNARQNGLESSAEELFLDWRQPIDRRFPVIFGCDVIYERQNHLPILGLLERCWLRGRGVDHRPGTPPGRRLPQSAPRPTVQSRSIGRCRASRIPEGRRGRRICGDCGGSNVFFEFHLLIFIRHLIFELSAAMCGMPKSERQLSKEN